MRAKIKTLTVASPKEDQKELTDLTDQLNSAMIKIKSLIGENSILRNHIQCLINIKFAFH